MESTRPATLNKLQQLQQQLEARADAAAQQLRERRDATIQRVQGRAQHLRDEAQCRALDLVEGAQGRVLDVGRDALDRAARAASRVEQIGPVHLAPISHAREVVEQGVESLSARRAKLDAPELPDYDELNVQQVNAQLDGLSLHALRKLRAYELAHKNRVTVLREVERLLQID